eukprot:tig00001249_g7779.t1
MAFVFTAPVISARRSLKTEFVGCSSVRATPASARRPAYRRILSARSPVSALRDAAAQFEAAEAKVSEVESEAEFEASLSAAGDALVVLNISTTWCGPCKVMAPKYEAMSEQFASAVFLKCMVRPATTRHAPHPDSAPLPSLPSSSPGDKNADMVGLCKKFNVKSVPTYLLFKNGETVDLVSGAKEAELREKVEKLAGAPVQA